MTSKLVRNFMAALTAVFVMLGVGISTTQTANAQVPRVVYVGENCQRGHTDRYVSGLRTTSITYTLRTSAYLYCQYDVTTKKTGAFTTYSKYNFSKRIRPCGSYMQIRCETS